jgi:RND family efflux transporter MFP subunit
MFEKIKNSLRKNFFLKFIIPIFALAMLGYTAVGLTKIPQRKITKPVGEIGESVYKSNVVGAGVTEPKSEIIEVGTEISGVISKVFVVAGDKVSKGEKLFKIDDKEAAANYDLTKAQYQIAKIQARNSEQQFSMFKKVKDKRAVSKDEFERKKYAYELDAGKVKEAGAQMAIAKVNLDKLTVKAPIDGEILKVNARPGQYAATGNPSKALMTIGDLSKMYVRVEIDETETYKVKKGNSATGNLRGRPEVKIPLEFVRFEPYVVPKTTITGGNTEKVDTRVLEVLYSFDNTENILVGQQMDVYIESD